MTDRLPFGVALRAARVPVVIVVGGLISACGGKLLLTEQNEARQAAAQMHVEFANAREAANRAVISESDEASATAAREANEATSAVRAKLDELTPIVTALGYADEISILNQFRNKFDEYQKLDAEVLPLAVENTNLKAQRLSFGPASEAANAFSAALDRIVAVSKSPDVEAAGSAARVALLQIQVLQARHIAEPDDVTMSKMEDEMRANADRVRDRLTWLQKRRPGDGAQIDAAAQAFDRFMATNAEIVQLSRRNSNVRSVAVTLGRKRVVAAECEEQLQALESTLATHTFKATR